MSRRRRVPKYPNLIGGRKVSFTRQDGTRVSFTARRRRRRQRGGINIGSAIGTARKVKGALTGKRADQILDGLQRALDLTRTGQQYLKAVPF